MEDAHTFFDAADDGNALIDAHRFERLFDLRLWIEKDHFRSKALERPSA